MTDKTHRKLPLNYTAAAAITKGVAGMLPDGYYTRSQVAAIVGRSASTIKSWERAKLIEPSAEQEFGQLSGTVKLYREDYVRTHVRKVADSMKPGRKPAKQ